ncbi:Alpha/Beta hydrolase protein [Vararia minispora EC-137]|uniref:Alpha/Beta hydrolase protein n=1 Tax=Vararia minispora EC-137 TaxID=1314806 RepID=A0ACB8Q9K6_9AGAM|nr:Alpha/Beta hydrolase protein [Vararia minispora EC-137]
MLKVLNQLNPIAQASGAIESLLGLGSGKPTINSDKYDELVHYFKYASTSYSLIILPRPNGQTLVTTASLNDILTDSHGYIARDDKKKEIVLAFRGSVTPTNFITDALFKLVAVDGPHISAPNDTRIHFGFQSAWNTLADKATTIVREQLAAYPGYAVVTTGHSLGGALASLAAVAVKQAHPTVYVLLLVCEIFEPRTGNAAFAAFVNGLIGSKNIYRVVHSYDGVPTMVPRALGYRHSGTEYWVLDPASAERTFICNAAGDNEEDPKGSMRVPSTGINVPHLEVRFFVFFFAASKTDDDGIVLWNSIYYAVLVLIGRVHAYMLI